MYIIAIFNIPCILNVYCKKTKIDRFLDVLKILLILGPTDKYITEDRINCTFLRDLNKYQHETINKESLSSLLKEFFVFYSQYDFSKNAICLNEAISITKPDFSPMYIVNPLDKGLNVSKNVSLEEVERFKYETINAAWILETEENDENWGLVRLLQNHNKKYAEMALASITKQERLMDVTTLFADGDQKEDTKYKNSEVKKQVNEIGKFTKKQIKKRESTMKIKR